MRRGKASNRILDFFLGIPVLNLIACFCRRGALPENPKRIGILLNPALGDTLLASAAIQDIRALFPAATLILFAASPNMAAAKLLPAVDSIEALPLTRPLTAIRILRNHKLDLMLDFTAWQRLTAMYSLLSGAKFKVGFERDKQHRHRAYDSTVPHRGDCHEIENLRRLAQSVGSQSRHAPMLLVPGGQLPQAVLEGRRVVVFHPCASGSQCRMREWPEDNWVNLARQLAARGRVFLVSGSPADETRCEALCRRLVEQGSPAEVLIGRNGLDEIARVLTHAEVLVSVNTGIMHLGAILGAPTVSLNGPTSPRRWGPVGPRVTNVCPSDGSGGFLDLGFEFHGHSINTMETILVEDVLSAIQSLCGMQFSLGSASIISRRAIDTPSANEDPRFPQSEELLEPGTCA
jgi:ADP-heptose:LPS heptosyltransferase